MAESGVKNTTAYKIVRQITDHIYGSDTKISSKEFVNIYKMYREAGGSWERLMAGDIGCVKIIEDVLEEFMEDRKISKIASKIASIMYDE